MSVTLVRSRPFSASTRVAAASSSWRVRSRRRSKRLEVRTAAAAAVDVLFITERGFSYLGAGPGVKRGEGIPLGRRLERDGAVRGRGSSARLRDQHRARPVLERDRRRVAVQDEAGEGAQYLAHGRHRLRERERGALEATNAVGEAEDVIADQLTAGGRHVDQAGSARGRARAVHGDERIAPLELEHGQEVVLGPG